MFRSVTPRVTTRHGLRDVLDRVCISPHRSFTTDSVAAPKRSLPSSVFSSARRPYNASKDDEGARRRPKSVSRHPREQPEEGPRLLRPSVLSERIKKLCQEDQLDDAVAMLKNAPLDAQNTIVWNTMISESMKQRRYKLAYQLYIDVRTGSVSYNL